MPKKGENNVMASLALSTANIDIGTKIQNKM